MIKRIKSTLDYFLDNAIKLFEYIKKYIGHRLFKVDSIDPIKPNILQANELELETNPIQPNTREINELKLETNPIQPNALQANELELEISDAVNKLNSDKLKTLLSQGGDINFLDKNGLTMLHNILGPDGIYYRWNETGDVNLTEKFSKKIVLLIKNGANINAVNRKGVSAFDYIFESRFISCITDKNGAEALLEIKDQIISQIKTNIRISARENLVNMTLKAELYSFCNNIAQKINTDLLKSEDLKKKFIGILKELNEIANDKEQYTPLNLICTKGTLSKISQDVMEHILSFTTKVSKENFTKIMTI